MWCRPEMSSVSPMYMPGRFRTASRPFRSLIESVVYAVLLIPIPSGRHGAQRARRRALSGVARPHLEDGGEPAPEPLRRRGAREEDRGVLGQALEKLGGPRLGESGVEVVGGEQGSLASRARD